MKRIKFEKGQKVKDFQGRILTVVEAHPLWIKVLNSNDKLEMMFHEEIHAL